MSRDEIVSKIRELAGARFHPSYSDAERFRPPFTIEDNATELLKALVEGQKIVTLERESNSGESWTHGDNSVVITLEDGSRLNFSGWGYDASGLITSYDPTGTTPRSLDTSNK